MLCWIRAPATISSVAAMSNRTRRAALAILTASLLPALAVTALAGLAPASAASTAARPAAGGVTGDPQPELKPFRIGPSAVTAGSVAVEPSGALVVAYGIGGGQGASVACVLARGKHACTSQVTLHATGNDNDLDGSTYAFVPAANRIAVLQGDTQNPLLFTSTDGGHTFGAPVKVGILEVTTAALVGDNIVWSDDESRSTQVQSVSLAHPGLTDPVTLLAGDESTDGVASYHSGALVASTSFSPSVTVMYAPAGRSFGAASSYHKVGSFGGQTLVAISGGALLTQSNSGREALQLRLFNGKSFGPAHTVPDTNGGGPEWFGLDQDPSGRVHVFNDSTHLARTYNLYEQSTSAGASWSGPLDLGNAIKDTGFTAGLDSRGSGLVLGTGGPGTGFPVLGSQSVSFTLARSSIRKGRSTTGSGTVSPGASGRVVQLQKERSGRWYVVGTSHQNASGKYSFTIKGNGTGTGTFRAVAADVAGYLLYGYSSSRSLRVTS
jgi:hypothetical protein